MITTVHTVAGGVIGEYTNNPVLAFMLAFILHFVLDALPHFDTTDNKKFTFRQYAFLAVDFIVAFYLVFVVLKPILDFRSPILWGAFGGLLPDLIDNVPFWSPYLIKNTKFGRWFHNLHENIHFQPQPSFVFGMLTQALIVLLFLWLHFAKIK